MDKVGKDGVITVEEGKTIGHDARVRRGHAVRPRLPVAVLRHRPENDGVRTRRPVHPDLREEDQLNRDLVPVLEKVLQQGKPLLIIAEEVEGEALATLVVNKIRARVQGAAPSRPPATATAARPCSKTSPS